MNMSVPCRGERRFQGSRGSENHEISRLKSEEEKSAPWGGTFLDVLDFWVPNGIPRGSIFAEKLTFFEILNFDDFRGLRGIPFGRGRRHGRTPWKPTFSLNTQCECSV